MKQAEAYPGTLEAKPKAGRMPPPMPTALPRTFCLLICSLSQDLESMKMFGDEEVWATLTMAGVAGLFYSAERFS